MGQQAKAVCQEGSMIARVLGIDPGTHVGWCVVDVSEGHAVWRVAGTLHLEAAGELSIAGALAGTANEWHVHAIAIEDFARKFCNPKQAQQMVQSAQSAGIIRGWLACQLSGMQLLAFSSYDWRKAIVGSSVAKDAQIEHALVEIQHVADMPKRSNPHVRDACGLAIHAGRVLIEQVKESAA
jgi:Holliday junction resolvasome RuvABC endonuclease subunit